MKTRNLVIILSVVSFASAQAGELENRPTTIKPSVAVSTPLGIVHGPQLNVDYPTIKLADGRVLSDARIASFDKKNLTFCVGHRNGIEGAVPWGAMPVVWQSAFPLVSPEESQRVALQAAAARASASGKPGVTSGPETKSVATIPGGEVVNYAPAKARGELVVVGGKPDGKATAVDYSKWTALDWLQQERNTSSIRRVGGGGR